MRRARLGQLVASACVLLALGVARYAVAQDSQAEVSLCLSRAAAILNSVQEGHLWALAAAALALMAALGLVYAVCRSWVRGGWFQSLLVVLVPLGAYLGVFWAMTATTLSRVPSGSSAGLGSFPFQTCRGFLPDVSTAGKERLDAIFSLGEAGSPFWHAMGIWTPCLVAGVSVLVLVVMLVVTRRHVRLDRAR